MLVRSTASSEFLVRAEISGRVTEWVFYCSCQLRSSASWGGKAGKKGPFSIDCTTERCACSMPCVFMAKWVHFKMLLALRMEYWWMESKICGSTVFISLYLRGKLEVLFGSWQRLLLWCQPWGLLRDFPVKSSEFGFCDPLQISWFLSAENHLHPWISLVNGVGTLLRKKINFLLLSPVSVRISSWPSFNYVIVTSLDKWDHFGVLYLA